MAPLPYPALEGGREGGREAFSRFKKILCVPAGRPTDFAVPVAASGPGVCNAPARQSVCLSVSFLWTSYAPCT